MWRLPPARLLVDPGVPGSTFHAIGSESSDANRDTDINLVSSPAQPPDPAWSRSQALFEDAVGDGTYFADPNCEWEEEVEETKHGGS